MSDHSQLIINAPAIDGILTKVDDSYDGVDAVLATMPGLLHYMDPDRLSGTAGVRNADEAMGTQAQITWTRGVTRTASKPGWNNRTALDLVRDNDLMIGPGTIKNSFSFICAASLAASVLAGTDNSYLLSTFSLANGYDIQWYFFGNAGKGLAFTPEANTAGNLLSVGIGSVGAMVGDTALIMGGSFDNTPAAGSKTGKIWVQSVSTPVATKSDFQAPAFIEDNSYWGIGNNRYDAALGWLGSIGKLCIFDRAYHLGTTLTMNGGGTITDIALMQSLLVAMKTHYAIP